MSTYDLLFERNSAAEKRPRILARLKQAWMATRRRRREAATVVELSRLDEHLLRDIGIEPQDVHDALKQQNLSILFSPVRR
jgi:uncharacterized protein YjiS (DUF1127 family)